MKAGFVKRFGAFLIDLFILSFIFSIVTVGNDVSSESSQNKLLDFQEKIESGELSDENMMNEYYDLFYDIQKSGLSSNVINVVLYIGYFVIFGYLNKGQTIGKKLVKIKVVNKNDDLPNIWNMLFRNIFIYGISTMLFSILFINIFDSKLFIYGYLVFAYFEFIIIIISFFMILYKKDGRGLHDMIAKTKVIEEVR